MRLLLFQFVLGFAFHQAQARYNGSFSAAPALLHRLRTRAAALGIRHTSQSVARQPIDQECAHTRTQLRVDTLIDPIESNRPRPWRCPFEICDPTARIAKSFVFCGLLSTPPHPTTGHHTQATTPPPRRRHDGRVRQIVRVLRPHSSLRSTPPHPTPPHTRPQPLLHAGRHDGRVRPVGGGPAAATWRGRGPGAHQPLHARQQPTPRAGGGETRWRRWRRRGRLAGDGACVPRKGLDKGGEKERF